MITLDSSLLFEAEYLFNIDLRRKLDKLIPVTFDVSFFKKISYLNLCIYLNLPGNFPAFPGKLESKELNFDEPFR